MDKVREKWNRIYSQNRSPGSPSTVLTDNLHLWPSRGTALDLACGLGANSLFLAARGLDVHAWDISEVAINHLAGRASSRGLSIQTQVVDITPEALPVDKFDLVVTSHYLDRSLPPAIMNATRPGGLICYQTFTAAKRVDIGPSNPDFLLQPNELQSFVPGCEILAFGDESHNTNSDDPLAGRAFIIAQKSPV
ncbi:MAG: methyltransferase domain-containing protein [Candidatus Azotimanducaceae bacterium WSBS_2022_MAG_OTU7]